MGAQRVQNKGNYNILLDTAEQESFFFFFFAAFYFPSTDLIYFQKSK